MKSLKIIIDGYNLIKSVPDGFSRQESLESQREHLLRILHSSPQLNNQKIVVVFDGSSGLPGLHPPRYRGIQVVFSGDKKEADDVIKEMIRTSGSPGNLQIVSSDLQIQFTAKDHGAGVIGSQEFWSQLNSPRASSRTDSSPAYPPDAELSDKEVRKWLELFKNREYGDKK
ncbi:MAG: NYN domain-containing protein [Calditrichia bacterium]